MYVLIEHQPTFTIQGVTVPAFYTVYPSDEKPFIPVFLSRIPAYEYIKTNALNKEFKLVSVDDFSLDTFRDICEQGEGSALYPCRLVMGLNKQQKFMCFNKEVSLNDIFYHREGIESTLTTAFGDLYASIKSEDAAVSEQALFEGAKKPSSFKAFFKSLFKPKTPQKEQSPVNVGQGHLFVVISSDSTFCCVDEGKYKNILLFANKMDAVIYSLIQQKQEKSRITYEAVKLTQNQKLMDLLKFGYKSGSITVSVVYGFLGVPTTLGGKWAKPNSASLYPSIKAVKFPLEEIENGFNLDDYFYYVTEKKELEEAIVALVNTNSTASSDLVGRATQIMGDMKTNSIVVSNEDPRTYHRMVFVGA
ncbi:MAG: hypothetical protein ACNA7Y_00250 [Gammaproteobacteria bacterium]